MKSKAEYLAEVLADVSHVDNQCCEDFYMEGGKEWDDCLELCDNTGFATKDCWLRWASWKARKEAKR